MLASTQINRWKITFFLYFTRKIRILRQQVKALGPLAPTAFPWVAPQELTLRCALRTPHEVALLQDFGGQTLKVNILPVHLLQVVD